MARLRTPLVRLHPTQKKKPRVAVDTFLRHTRARLGQKQLPSCVMHFERTIRMALDVSRRGSCVRVRMMR